MCTCVHTLPAILSHFAFMIVYRCICAHSSFVAHSCVFYVQSLCACTHSCACILSCITINKHFPHQCMSMVDDAYLHLCISVCKQHSFRSHFIVCFRMLMMHICNCVSLCANNIHFVASCAVFPHVDDAYLHVCINVCTQHSFHSHFVGLLAC